MNVRIRCDMNFSAGVYYAEQFRINHYSLRLWIITNHNNPETHNIALERIKHFVYSKLDGSVFVNSDHLDQCQKYITAGLNVTTLPAEPVDQIIGIMLYYKLNAIMEKHMIIVETELSSVLGDNIVYLHSEDESIDPNLMADWWESPDLIHCDQSVMVSEKVLTIPAHSVWRDLNLSWPEQEGQDHTGNVVVFADFKNNDPK